MEADHIGVHETHCCIIHGCKYGDSDCPVSLGEAPQVFPCEDCDTDLIISLEGFEEVARLKEFELKYYRLLKKYKELIESISLTK